VLIYLWVTRKHSLTYGGKVIMTPEVPSARPPINPKVVAALSGLFIFSDASWKVDSTYAGFLILYMNAAVDWTSKLLKVQLSSAEAEIAAGTIASKRAIYVRHFLGFVEALPNIPIPHVIDNSALPALTENMGVSRKTEHFRRWQHFMRYAVTHGYVYTHLARTFEMHANALTKVENLEAFIKFVRIAMNVHPSAQ
jgi:hypothetical protein